MSRVSPLIEQGWFQWVILDRQCMTDCVIEHVDGHELGFCSHFVVATQTCCIAHASYLHEPFMELIGGVLIEDEPDKRLIGGYSPRELHVPINLSGEVSTLHLEMRNRVFIPRELFENFSPSNDINVSERYMQNLQVWMASRYCRPAFPDSFVKRVLKFANKLAEKLSKYSARFPDDLIMVLVTLTTNEELGADFDYECEWKLVHSAGLDEDREAAIQEIETAFSSKLDKVLGISGTFVAFDESEVSILELREGERWFFDYISYRGDEIGPVVEDGQY